TPSLMTSTAPLLRTRSLPVLDPAVSTSSPGEYFVSGRSASLCSKATASGTRGMFGPSFRLWMAIVLQRASTENDHPLSPAPCQLRLALVMSSAAPNSDCLGDDHATRPD